MKNLVKKLLTPKPTALEFFHSKTKLKSLLKQINEQSWPQEWIKIHFKSYPRFHQLFLPKKFLSTNIPIEKVIVKRRSKRDFDRQTLNLNELSTLLFYAGGITKKSKSWNNTKRGYPSAEARYPLEIYPLILNVKGAKSGIYHYNLKAHSLEILLEGNFRDHIIAATQEKWISNASVVLLISAVFGRTQIKYGDRGYRFILLEAGHLGQNFHLLSTALNLKCCAVGGFVDDKLNELLNLPPAGEGVIYILAIGK